MHTPNNPSMPIQQKGYTLVELAIAVALLRPKTVSGHFCGARAQVQDEHLKRTLCANLF